ncbi:hypothetical protein K474DRAFT_1619824 [Panus rudis PR-1116 ss-1]|nr:hypothetical protein K474DRAFT_1619824 [Panus rudis PR-1116 ss-1]
MPLSADEVKAKLEQLRDNPADTQGAPESVLAGIYEFLLNKNTPADGKFHWFCSEADPVVVQAAIFLIRLHAYNSARVETWRSHLRRCLFGCCECVRVYQEAKHTSRKTYFGAFQDHIMSNFLQHVSKWEADSILKVLSERKLYPPNISGGRTLSDAPSVLTYYICSNPDILRDSRILDVLHNCAPTRVFTDWPTDAPPPGLFLLLLDNEERTRSWATQQIARCTVTPMAAERFTSAFREVIEVAVTAVAPNAANASSGPSWNMPFSNDLTVLWSGFSVILRFIPPKWLMPEAGKVDIRKVVTSHLPDFGSHFVHVLKSFVLLLNRIGSGVWDGEGSEYPVVVFSNVKDNPSYSEALLSNEKESWLLGWVESYLKSVGELPAFKDVLPVVMQFFCEELQHERFKDTRSRAVIVAAKCLGGIIEEWKPGAVDDIAHEAALASLDIHSNLFASVAFGKLYDADQWREARRYSRVLIKQLLPRDIKLISATINSLSTKSNVPTSSPTVRERLWTKMYEFVQPSDLEGIAIIISIVAKISHIDDLSPAAVADVIKHSPNPESSKKASDAVNHALSVFRSGFSDAVSRFVDFSSSEKMLSLLRQSTPARDLVRLMFSPVENIREPAQSIVGFALDAESRQDCFRALLTNCTRPAMKGIFEFLDTFIGYAAVVPEACNVSKSLALCLTDIIDVMCSSPDGLLLKKDFLKNLGGDVAQELLRWWSLMTKALSVIFQKTPRWAVYFENAEMILWMRDALIFGRDMLAQRKVIESAALGLPDQASTTNRKLSKVGKKMVDDLQPVLFELSRWLRLTDEELLHQSFALLQSLLSCYLETNISPSDITMKKLQKVVDDSRKGDNSRPATNLDSTRIERLSETLSAFDDEVEIVEPPPKPKKKERPEVVITVNKKEPVPSTSRLKPQTTKERQVSVSRPSKSTFFSADDQRKLDTAGSLPRFTSSSRTGKTTVVPTKPSGSSRATSTDGKTSSHASSDAASSSDEESEDDGEGTLASLAKMQRTPKVKKPERRQVKMLDVPTNIKNPAIERMRQREDARRTGLRLKPDISPLHRTVLSWNYDDSGPEPPGNSISLNRVPDKFNDPNHYRRIFEPLLLMECWAQIQQSKDEPHDSYECRIVSRQYTDDWLDMDITIEEGVKQDWNLMETDVVLLRQAGGQRSWLAKTQNFRTQFNAPLQATLRLVSSNEPGPQIGSNWKVSKVFSLTTVHREYAALMGLPYYDLCNIIMQPDLKKHVVSDQNEVRQTMSKYNLNEPQAKAILAAMQTNGFSLIQGPPGTGKTSTICGMVQMFLATRPKPATAVHVGRSSGPADREPPKKILLCAPSNAAIDEITYRLKEGVTGAGKWSTAPKVVRVGAPKAINISVKDVSLDSLVEQKLDNDPDSKKSSKDANSEISRLRSELGAVKQKRADVLQELANIRDNSARTLLLEEEIKKLNKQRVALTHQLDKLRDQQKSDFRTMDAISRRYRTEVLQEADVICSTLSGAGHELLESYNFEMVIIDEAAQAIELSSLIPLKYLCNRCVMVGDPQQLPPTVISQEASKYGYNQSLFVRLMKQRPDVVHLLSIQYRMHPDISQLPSRLFYGGKLIDGPDMAVKTQGPWHANPKFGTYRFFNVNRGQEESGSQRSLMNRTEAQVAVALYNRLVQEYSSHDMEFKIGVVTMYRAQVNELRRAFSQRFGSSVLSTVDFNTVDGFQGQEKDIIILSCVRAGPGLTNVGFLSDVRRMNVALTRAKASVFVLGHAATLERSDQTWRAIVEDARNRSRLIDTDVTFFTSPISKVPTSKSVKPPSTAKTPKSSDPALPAGLVPLGSGRATKPREDEVKVEAKVESKAKEPTSMDVDEDEKKPALPGPSNPNPRKRPAVDPPSENVPQINGSEPKPKPRPLVKRPKKNAADALWIKKK